MKKLIALSIALLMLVVPALTACPGNTGGGGGSTTTQAQDTTADPYTTVDADGNTVYKVVAPKYDCGGRGFNILVRGDGGNYADVDFTYDESKSGEPINDAAYRRALEIEEMYNLKINTIPAPQSQHVNLIRTSVQAGDKLYDITFNGPRVNGTLAREGLLCDLYKFPNINLSEPWWDKNLADSISVNHQLFQMGGDISIAYKKTVSLLLFNKQMLSDLGLESPYTLISENKWTFDKVSEMCKAVWDTYDSAATPAPNSVYGMLGITGTITQAIVGCGLFVCQKDENDLPYISFDGENMADVWGKLSDFFFDRTMFYNVQASYGSSRDNNTKFQSNEGLFYWYEAQVIPSLRAMDTDFGILPNPKFSEDQPRYYQYINSIEATMLAIPIGKSDEEKAPIGAVTSALATLGKNYLTPAYYDTTLKGKLTRDTESEGNLDIIFNSVYFDFGRVYNVGGFADDLNSASSNSVKDMTSYFTARQNKIQTDLDKTVADYLAIQQ